MSNAICTIISKNYISYARTLAKSYNGTVFVLCVDELTEDITNEPFIIIEANKIGIPKFEQFAFKYSILELNTAVKPFFIEYLYNNLVIDKLIYFDPDILILNPIDELFDYLDTYNILLTPHITSPIPDDGKSPAEKNISLSGTFNLGFIGLGNYHKVKDFINWWKDRLIRYCINNVADGFFVDQKWINLVPGFMDEVLILRDVKYNIAYWNLHERHITKSPAKFLVNDRPISFYHFSGIVPSDVDNISKYQNRISFQDNPELKSLFDMYRQSLIENGYHHTCGLKYTYGFFVDGTPIPFNAHRMYFNLPEEVRDELGNPFDNSNENSFYKKYLCK